MKRAIAISLLTLLIAAIAAVGMAICLFWAVVKHWASTHAHNALPDTRFWTEATWWLCGAALCGAAALGAVVWGVVLLSRHPKP